MAKSSITESKHRRFKPVKMNDFQQPKMYLKPFVWAVVFAIVGALLILVGDAAPDTGGKDCKQETCNFLAVGDSTSGGESSWRVKFKELASEAGYKFNYVGARSWAAPGVTIKERLHGYLTPGFDPLPGQDDQHEAFGGACIGDGNPTNCANLGTKIGGFRGTDKGLWGRIDIWSNIIEQPDVIVLLGGHNGGGDKAAQFAAYLEKLYSVVPDNTYTFISGNGGASGVYPRLVTMAEQYREKGMPVYAINSFVGVNNVHPVGAAKDTLTNNIFNAVDGVLSGAKSVGGGSGGNYPSGNNNSNDNSDSNGDDTTDDSNNNDDSNDNSDDTNDDSNNDSNDNNNDNNTNTTKSPDIDNNGSINLLDITTLIASWNTATPAYDLDDDGTVGFGDIMIIISKWTG